MTCARKSLYTLALVILGLGFSSYTHAINVYEQLTDGTGIIQKPANNSVLIGEFTTTSSVALDTNSFIVFSAKDTDGFNCTAFNVGIYADGQTVGPLISTNSFDISSSYDVLTKYFSSSYTLSSSTNYDVRLNASCNPGTADVVSNSVASSFYGVLSNTVATSTRVTTINEPLGGTISTSTVVVFDYDFFFNSDDFGDIHSATIELTNTTNPQSVYTLSVPILASGNNTFRQSYTLQEGNSYSWRPLLVGSSTSVYGNINLFSVVSNPYPNTPLVDNFSTSTATSTTPSIYLNIVSLIQNKHPIAYIPQVISILRDNATLTGTSSFPTLQFDFTNSRLGSTTLNLTTVDMFSTTTITYFFGSTQIQLFKTLVTAVVWVGVVLFLIRDIRRTFLNTKV